MNDILIYPAYGIRHMIEKGANPFNNRAWALISIWGTTQNDEELLNHQARQKLQSMGCHQTLSICFDDVAADENGYTPFSTGQAKMILEFLNNIQHLDVLAVHCQAGISRSGAIGLYACRYYHLNERRFLDINPRLAPNPHILSMLCKQHNPLFELKE